jgi:uncharacterized membrane protein YphA (DoxX/SURF4 family)
MRMHEPIGNAIYGPLIIRVCLGSYFMIAGWLKLDNVEGFINEVKGFKILPDELATVYGILLPYLEIGAGGLLIIGIWTTMVAFIVSLMLLSFVLAIGVFPSKTDLFNKDIILMASTLSLLYSGAGAFSIDRFRKSG